MTLLLAAGMLALEREENAFGRLVRGLVSRLGLVVEKVGLAALCAFVVCLLMLVVLAVFVDLDWGRAPLWIPALARRRARLRRASASPSAAWPARCARRRCSSSPSRCRWPRSRSCRAARSATASTRSIEVVNFVLPFKWALQALDAAINDAEPALLVPALHLLGLTVAFVGIARLALRRFA